MTILGLNNPTRISPAKTIRIFSDIIKITNKHFFYKKHYKSSKKYLFISYYDVHSLKSREIIQKNCFFLKSAINLKTWQK